MILVNIGMAIGSRSQKDYSQLTEREVSLVLRAMHISVMRYEIKASYTEPTFVAELTHALSPNKAWQLAANLDQECIAQDNHGWLELYGPQADDWKPANRDYFLTI